MIEWLAAMKLVLNLDKADTLQSITNYLSHSSLSTVYEENVNTQFVGV